MIQIQIEEVFDIKEDKEIRITGVKSGKEGMEKILIAVPYDLATQLLDALHFAGHGTKFKPITLSIEESEN